MAGPPKAGQLPISETHKIITRYLVPVGTKVQTVRVQDTSANPEMAFDKTVVTLTSEMIFSDDDVVVIESVDGRRLPGSMCDAPNHARYVRFKFKHNDCDYIIRVRMGDILEGDFIARIVLSDDDYKTLEDILAEQLRKSIDEEIMKELQAEMQKNLLAKMFANSKARPYIPISVV